MQKLWPAAPPQSPRQCIQAGQSPPSRRRHRPHHRIRRPLTDGQLRPSLIGESSRASGVVGVMCPRRLGRASTARPGIAGEFRSALRGEEPRSVRIAIGLTARKGEQIDTLVLYLIWCSEKHLGAAAAIISLLKNWAFRNKIPQPTGLMRGAWVSGGTTPRCHAGSPCCEQTADHATQSACPLAGHRTVVVVEQGVVGGSSSPADAH